MHSTQKIIENQKKFKEEIYSFFSNERDELKKMINNINSQDNYIVKEKNKLKNRINKIKQKDYIDRLFFLNSCRNLILYVWWDEEEKEAKIFKYDKR